MGRRRWRVAQVDHDTAPAVASGFAFNEDTGPRRHGTLRTGGMWSISAALRASCTMTHLGLLDWSVFACYLAVVFALGIAFARGQRDKDSYLVVSRRMNLSVVGAALFATAFRSLSFVALPREGAYED